MKIENIIEDIQKDIKELRDMLEEQFKVENPGLHLSVDLPGIEELTTVKTVAMTIEEGNATYYLSVQIHTHNGNRVFENATKKNIHHQPVQYSNRHPLQDRFVEMLRDIIKKQKVKLKSGNKTGNLYNDLRQYGRTA